MISSIPDDQPISKEKTLVNQVEEDDFGASFKRRLDKSSQKEEIHSSISTKGDKKSKK